MENKKPRDILSCCVSPSLTDSLLKDQKHDAATYFLVVKYSGHIGGEKISLPTLTRPIIKPPKYMFHFIFGFLIHGHTKRQCPDPIVGLGARLHKDKGHLDFYYERPLFSDVGPLTLLISTSSRNSQFSFGLRYSVFISSSIYHETIWIMLSWVQPKHSLHILGTNKYVRWVSLKNGYDLQRKWIIPEWMTYADCWFYN